MPRTRSTPCEAGKQNHQNRASVSHSLARYPIRLLDLEYRMPTESHRQQEAIAHLFRSHLPADCRMIETKRGIRYGRIHDPKPQMECRPQALHYRQVEDCHTNARPPHKRSTQSFRRSNPLDPLPLGALSLDRLPMYHPTTKIGSVKRLP
jgi:hypothetical protein